MRLPFGHPRFDHSPRHGAGLSSTQRQGPVPPAWAGAGSGIDPGVELCVNPVRVEGVNGHSNSFSAKKY